MPQNNTGVLFSVKRQFYKDKVHLYYLVLLAYLFITDYSFQFGLDAAYAIDIH